MAQTSYVMRVYTLLEEMQHATDPNQLADLQQDLESLHQEQAGESNGVYTRICAGLKQYQTLQSKTLTASQHLGDIRDQVGQTLDQVNTKVDAGVKSNSTLPAAA